MKVPKPTASCAHVAVEDQKGSNLSSQRQYKLNKLRLFSAGRARETMKRQFVNLAVENYKNATFTVHGIKPSSLFHPRRQTKGRPLPLPPTSPSPVEAELPKPAFTHSLYTRREGGGRIMFMPYGSSRDKILSVDHDSNVLVHDICQNKLCSMPRPEQGCSRANSIAIMLGDALYVIDRCPYEPDLIRRSYHQPCFQALIHGEPPAGVFGFPGWYWHTLPLPHYVEAPGYEPSGDTKIASSTVVGDSIWVSARGRIGSTYSFSTTSCAWSKVGSWELPFRGPAEYVPELGRWLGFSRGRENQFLCASDLAAAAADGAAAPTLCHVWKEDLATNPENWMLLNSDLVRVDSGRFCTARLFHVYDEYPYLKEQFAVLTGVELVPSDTADDCGIRMVKHKSIRYNVDGKAIRLIC